MRVVELQDITKKESPLHYRNEYSGKAVLDIDLERPVERRLSFILEHAATGMIAVTVTLHEAVNYPLVPVINSLKDYILKLRKEGKLD